MGRIRSIMTGVTLLASVTGVAQAQLGVTYSTTGCFDYAGHACPTAANPYASTVASGTDGSLVFNGVTNTSQVIPVGGGSINLGTLSIHGYDNGTFSLPINDYNDGSYNNTFFKLFVDFSAPTGAGDGFYTAVLNGTLSRADDGKGVTVDFGGPQNIAYAGGIMTLTVNDPATYKCDYSYNVGLVVGGTCTGLESQTITGSLSYTTTTPEPSSMALLGTGLVGLVPMARRRRK